MEHGTHGGIFRQRHANARGRRAVAGTGGGNPLAAPGHVTLLDTYIGHQSGERILAGRIRRGDTEAIRAVIWLSDLRGFTALADRLPGPTVIALLNRYYDCQIPAILARGGEVLKLMGDGLLAIFPVASEEAAATVCAAALEAAREARAQIAALRDPVGDGSVDRLRF